MFDQKTTKHDDDSSMKKSVRINDKAEDLREVHAARLTNRLRRMKRRLLLDALADDPTNSGIAGNSDASINSSRSHDSLRDSGSSSSSRDDDDGETAFGRGRMVRYNAGSSSFVFDSSSSVFSELAENELEAINQAVEQRRDDVDY